MADDRFDPEPRDDRDFTTPEDEAESDRWVTENIEYVKAKLQETLENPRPALSAKEVFDDVRAHLRRLIRERDALA